MPGISDLLTEDGKIMRLRALGYSQEEIAKFLKVSQPAVSQRFSTIRKRTRKAKDDDLIFWELLLGIGAKKLLEKMFDESIRKKMD